MKPWLAIADHGFFLQGTWQAIRLHLVSGDAPDRENAHIRLAGRI
jgi:hypothetical protein